MWCETCFPSSQTGKKLMAKCRMLIQENQELGRQLSQGRIAQLEAELALQKKYSEELKSSQDGEKVTRLVFVPLIFLIWCFISWQMCVLPIPLRAEWLYHPARRGGGGHAEHHSCPATAAEGVSSANVSNSGVVTRSWTQQDFPRSLQLLRRTTNAARAGWRPPRDAGQRLREGEQWTKQWQLIPEERDRHARPVPGGQQHRGRLSNVPHGLQPRRSRDQTVEPFGGSDRESDNCGQSCWSRGVWEPAQRRVRERGLSNGQRDVIDSTFKWHRLHHRPPRGQGCPGNKGLQDCRLTAHSERPGLQRQWQYGFVMYLNVSFFVCCFFFYTRQQMLSLQHGTAVGGVFTFPPSCCDSSVTFVLLNRDWRCGLMLDLNWVERLVKIKLVCLIQLLIWACLCCSCLRLWHWK